MTKRSKLVVKKVRSVFQMVKRWPTIQKPDKLFGFQMGHLFTIWNTNTKSVQEMTIWKPNGPAFRWLLYFQVRYSDGNCKTINNFFAEFQLKWFEFELKRRQLRVNINWWRSSTASGATASRATARGATASGANTSGSQKQKGQNAKKIFLFVEYNSILT